MPLPRAKLQQLVETNFQGLNIERGVLVRPVNSFTKLENFDLVKPGVIRKVRGNSRLTPTAIDSAIVGFRDYQKVPNVPPILAVVDAKGGFYITLFSEPVRLTLVDYLYPHDIDPSFSNKMDEAPFMVSLPFMEYDVGTKLYDTVQYIVITVGDKDPPKYYDGVKIYNLGIPNPGDGYTVPFEHSVSIPMTYYTNNLPPNEETHFFLLRGTSPNAEDGIPLHSERRYRASWYNPITGHDSSLFPLALNPLPLEDAYSGLPEGDEPFEPITTNTRPAGIVVGTINAPYVMAIPLFLSNLTDVQAHPLVMEPQPGYTHIRFWATRAGGIEYYLVPTIYDARGKVVSDIRGAVNFMEVGLRYGVQVLGDLIPEPLFDGYVPLLRYDELGFRLGAKNWTRMIQYNWDGDYHVLGADQDGDELQVTLKGNEAREVVTGYFQIDGDDTIYRIIDVPVINPPNHTWIIDPPLAIIPADDAIITLQYIKPTADMDLLTAWTETQGPNSDRQNDGPPKASWGTVYQNRLFLVDAEDKTKLVYSRIAHYEDFPPDNVFRFTQGDYDPITAVLSGRQVGLVSEGADSRVVVGKQRTSAQITGTTPEDFAIRSLFAETGIVHKRAAIVISGFLLAQTRQGLELLDGQRPVFIGSFIKDIIDGTFRQEYGPCFAMDRMENQILLGIQNFPADDFDDDSLPAAVVDGVILVREPRFNPDGSLASPFSTMTLPSTFGVIQESGFGKQVRMLAGSMDGHIYHLFTGDTDFNGNPVKATAETQLLPQTDRESRKIFHRIQFEGNEIDHTDWKIQFEMDGNGYWTPVRKMYTETLIGLVGKQLKIRIIHDGIPLFVDNPMLSNFMLEYTPIGEAR